MLSMVIVEDEALERMSLSEYIDWKIIGVRVEAVAINGSQGLSKVLELKPDIVLTDVKMPVMDGIEMAQKIHHIMPDVKIIFLSSYDDFEYAPKAIDFNAFAYITKPISEMELLRTVKRAADEVTERMLETSLLSKIKNDYQSALSLARQTAVHQHLMGSSVSGHYGSLKLGWLLNPTDLCLFLSVYDHIGSKRIIDNIETLNIRSTQSFPHSISICVTAGVLVTLVSLSEETSTNDIPVMMAIISEYFEENDCRNVRIEYLHNKTDSIPANELYLNLLHKMSDYNLNTRAQVRQKSKKTIIAEIERIILDNYHRPLTIEAIAKQIYFTPNYIGAIFRAEKKISINQYIQDVRMRKAEQLLRNFDVPISDIAISCGYENITYFYSVFKKLNGLTPREYRNSLHRRENPHDQVSE